MTEYLVEVIDWPVRIDGHTFFKGDNFRIQSEHLTESFKQYVKVLGEVADDQVDDTAFLTPNELDELTEDELKSYANEKGIKLGRATSKEGIIKKIMET